MAAVGAFRAGKNSRVVVEATNLTAANWRVTRRGDDLDTTNFESAGQEQGLIGVEVSDWSLGGDWDSAQNRFTDPPGLFPRDDLGEIQFYTNLADADFHNITDNRVLSAENGAEVRGKVTFSASGKSQGAGATLPGSEPVAAPMTPEEMEAQGHETRRSVGDARSAMERRRGQAHPVGSVGGHPGGPQPAGEIRGVQPGPGAGAADGPEPR